MPGNPKATVPVVGTGRCSRCVLAVHNWVSRNGFVPFWTKNPWSGREKDSAGDRKTSSRIEKDARGEEMAMITWVLAQEPTAAVKRALEILEERVGSDAEVMWLCPELTEPVQE